MKNIILTVTFTCLLHITDAQISLIGMRYNPSSGAREIVEWQALDSASPASYPTALTGYLLASSLFDSYNGNYYLTGYSGDTNGLFSFNSVTHLQGLSSFSSFSNITEIDMSTGRIFTLSSDSIGYVNVDEYTLSTGQTTLLGVVQNPGVFGLVVDAIGFDSNKGILYYIGKNETGDHFMYRILTREPVFTYQIVPVTKPYPQCNIYGVCFDNVNNRLFSQLAVFDGANHYLGNKVVEIDDSTGWVTERGTLEGFKGYLVSSASFDQQSGSYLLVGIDTADTRKMIVFDTYSNTFQTGFVPENVSEIVCDNYAFAKSTYGNNAIPEPAGQDFTLYPVPCSGIFTVGINAPVKGATLSISDLRGRILFNQEILHSPETIDAGKLPEGMYIVLVVSEGKTCSRKLIIR